MIKIAFLTVILFLLGCVPTKKAQFDELASLDEAHFMRTVSKSDDEFDLVATFTTINGFKRKQGLLGIVWDDVFVRAFVDKKTGVTSYQIYNIFYYKADGWRHYNRVNYIGPNGAVSSGVTRIDWDVDCTNSKYTGCLYEESVGFNLPQDVIDHVINYKPSASQSNFWTIKYKTKSGVEHRSGITQAELGGLVRVVENYKRAKGIGTEQNSLRSKESPSDISDQDFSIESAMRESTSLALSSGCSVIGSAQSILQTQYSAVIQVECKERSPILFECGQNGCKTTD